LSRISHGKAILTVQTNKDTSHVFTSTIGTPIDDRRIRQEFNALVEAAKLPKQRFHDLRHACITLLGAQDRSCRQDGRAPQWGCYRA
jgi:integrase